MGGRSVRRLVVAGGAASLLCPAVAWADQVIEAGPPNRFTTREVTMDQGERLTFRNGDTTSHDVVASTAGPDGKPLFATPIVKAGKEAFVEGSQHLTEGHYAFICSLHPGMKGTVHVTGRGTPQPRPEPGPAESLEPADVVRPSLAVALVSRSMAMARAREALVVRVELSERSHVELRAVARPRSGGPLVVVAWSVRHQVTGTQRLRLTLTRAGRRALSTDRTLAVIVRGTAIDAAGNMGRAHHGRTLTS